MFPRDTCNLWLQSHPRLTLLRAVRNQYSKNDISHVSRKIILRMNTQASEVIFLEVGNDVAGSNRGINVSRIFLVIGDIQVDFTNYYRGSIG